MSSIGKLLLSIILNKIREIWIIVGNLLIIHNCGQLLIFLRFIHIRYLVFMILDNSNACLIIIVIEYVMRSYNNGIAI